MERLHETLDRLLENYETLKEIKELPLYKREVTLLERTQQSLLKKLKAEEEAFCSGTLLQGEEPEYTYYINLAAHVVRN